MANIDLNVQPQNSLAGFGAQPIQDSNFLTKNFGKNIPTNSELTLAGGFQPDFNFGSSDPLNLNGNIQSPEGFDFTNTLSNFSLGAQGITGLASAYNAFKQNKLLKEQLGLQRGFSNRNLANSAVTTNAALANQANLASQLTTGAELGTPQQIAAEKALTKTVDGSPIT